MTDEVLIEDRGPITIPKLNRPEKLNAWNRAITQQLSDYLRGLNEGEYRTRCLILTGEGRAFCSGADVGGLASSTSGERPPWRPPHTDLHPSDVLRRCDVPIIGAINGYALGAGFGVAMATDIRIAADDARFQVTQMKRGLFPDGGLGHLLPQAIGDQRALEMMFTARMVEAQEALEMGPCSRSFPVPSCLTPRSSWRRRSPRTARSVSPPPSAWSTCEPTSRGNARRSSPAT